MKAAAYAVAVGAPLLLSESTVAVEAMGGGWRPLECAVDLESLCTGLTPGEGRIPACMMSQLAGLSVSCSAVLSRAAWVAKECEADEKRFCGAIRSGGGRMEACMRPHLGEVSDACRRAMAFIAAPGAYH